MTNSHVVYALYTMALVLQLAGAAIVVFDVIQAQRNMAQFKTRLDEAKEARQAHVAEMTRQSGKTYPGFNGGTIRGPVIRPEAREQIADQLGPSSKIERQALTDFVTAEYSISKVRRWTGVTLLFVGTISGYVGSMLSVS